MSTAADSSERAPRALRSGWTAWVLVPTILGAAVGVIVAARTTPLYQSSILLLVEPQRVPEAYVRSPTLTTDRLQGLSAVMLSRTRLERLIEEFNLYQQERRTGLMQDVVENMSKRIEVNVEEGQAVRISFVGTEPTTVMKVAQRLAASYIEASARRREDIAQSTSQFLEASLEDVRRRFVERDKRLRVAQRKGEPEAETLAIEYDVLKTTFKDLSAKVEESHLAANLQRRMLGETFTLSDPAAVPERPFTPDRRLCTAIGAASGLGAGLLLFFTSPRGLFKKGRPDEVAPPGG